MYKGKQEGKNRNEQYMEIFSARLKELRDEKRISQKVVAEKLGVAVSTYANWEQGRREPSICDIYRLLNVFEIEANDLFDLSAQ